MHGHAPADAIVVPDAHFLFHADFKRSGLDLLLHQDDHELVLHDYFKGEKRAALASPDGAHLTGDIVNALTGSVDVAQAGGAAAAGQVIGHVTKLVGSATAIRNGVSIILNNGDNVEKGDVVQSGSDSTLGITFIDGTVFGLSANARMVLNEMVYDPNGSNNSSLLSLVAGTITFVAGETAKHGDMKVDTPVATMGIRGTAVLVEIDFTVPGQGATPDAHFQVLVEPDGTTGSYILFDKTTLQPLAVVNQAGQQINISNGVLSQSSTPLSPDIEKLIQDVFTLKFSANDTNPKTTTAQTDTINPLLFGSPIKLANGTTATPVYQQTALTGTLPTGTTPDNLGPITIGFIDHPPSFTSSAQPIKFSGGQHTPGGTLSSSNPLSGTLSFTDIDLGDTHTLALTMSAVMSDGEQLSSGLQDIFKNALKISLATDSSSTGNGVVAWQLAQLPVYLADFIPAGQTLTLSYTVTVIDSHGKFADTTLTVTITGTEQPAVVWIATTTGEPTGASWNDAANWETKTVPTAADDVIIITNQLIGLTPNYPVKVGAKDAAHSVTMNDYSGIAPELDILSGAKLTIGSANGNGSGGIFLNSDSKLHISGTLTLENGGDFSDQSQVMVGDGGTIEIAGGTLTVSVDVANLGQFTADKGTTLTLNSGTIDGGDAQGTLSIFGTLNLEGTSVLKNGALVDAGEVNVGGTVVFDNEAVTNNAPSALDITDALTLQNGASITNGEGAAETVESHASLTLLDTSFIGGGLVTNEGALKLGGSSELENGQLNNTGSVNVSGSGVVFDGEVVSNMGAGSIDIAGALTLQNRSTIANGGGNADTVESEASLTLSDTSSISGGRVINEGTLNLAGSSELQSNQLDNTGRVNVSGSNVVFNQEAVSNTGAGSIDITGALTLQNGSSVSNGEGDAVTVESEASLTLSGASFISGGLVTVEGALNLAHSSKLESGQLDNVGAVNISGTGVVLDGETVGNTGVIAIDATAALTIDHGSTVTGDGEIRIDRIDLNVGQLVLNDATIDGALVVNSGAFDLTGSAVLKNGTLEDDNYIVVSGVDNALHNENVTVGGAITVSSEAELTIDQGSTVTDPRSLEVDGALVLNDATIDAGVVYVDAGGILNMTGSTTLSAGELDDVGQVNVYGAKNLLDGETVSNIESGAIDITGALTLQNGSSIANGDSNSETVESAASLTLSDTSFINAGLVVNHGTLNLAGSSELKSGQLDNAGSVNVSGSGVVFDGETVTNSGAGGIDITGGLTLQNGSSIANGEGSAETVEREASLTLSGTSYISGGLVTNEGTLNLADSSKLTSGQLDNTGSVNVSGSGVVYDGETVNNTGAGAVDITGALRLQNGSSITGGEGDAVRVESEASLRLFDKSFVSGGLVANEGTLNLADSSELKSGQLDNTGGVNVSGSSVVLDAETVNNTAAGSIDITGALTLQNGSSITNGESNAETVEREASLTLQGASIVGGELINLGMVHVETSAGATFDGVSVDNAKGTIQVDFESTPPVTLQLDDGTTITGGMLAIGKVGKLDVSTEGGATLSGMTVDNSNLIKVDAGSQLTLDQTTISGGSLDNCGTISIETTATSTFDGVGVNNAYGTIQVDFGVDQPVTLQLDHGTTITGGTLDIGKVGELEVSTEGGATLSGVTVENSHLVHADEGSVLALDGSTIDNGNLVNDGIINSTGISAIDGADITNDGVIEALSGTLTIDPGTLSNSSTLEADGGELDLSGETVDNTGTIGATGGGLLKLMSSTIDNSGDGKVTVDAGSTLDLDHSGISGGTLTINGTLDNVAGSNTITSAVIETGTGAIVISGGSLDFAGSVTGDIKISGDATVELSATGASAYAGTTVTFAAGATGTLVLDHAESFKGTITGLDDNSIDLADISYASNPTVSYANGVLSVFVCGVDVANLDVTGDYSGVHWVLADDGTSTHGTTLTEVPGAITGLDAHGNADQGSALSVSITDGGAAVTGVTYDWQVSTDGVHWSEAGGSNGLSTYTPVEADEGQSLRVALSFTDAAGKAETSTASAGTVHEIAGGDLVTTLDSTTAQQGATIHVTGVTDGGVAVSDVTYNWQVSSDGIHWTEAHGTNGQSSYTPVEADEGLQLHLVTTLANDPSGPESATNSLGVVGEIAGGDLVATLDSATAQQGTTIHVKGVTDGGVAVSDATYDWQVSSDGIHWSEAHGTNGQSSYTPVEDDGGLDLRLVTTLASAPSGPESTTNDLGVVSQGDHDLVTTLSTSTAEQGLQITVTGVTDDGKAVTSGVSYSWEVSSNGIDWGQVSTNSYYAPTEQDEGNTLRLVTSYIEPSGHTDQTVNDLGNVADIVPTLVAPFSVAVDEMKVVKNGTQVFDDHFAQAPPAAGTFGNSAVQFITQGSTWTDVGGKGIMSAAGVQTLPTVDGAEVLARLGTNNQDESVSGGGLKENATFTVSTIFDLTVPQFAGQQYGIDLNDSSATHGNDEMVQLYVVGDGHGGATVKLVQADFATTTFTTLASEVLDAKELAGNNQIELDLAHLTKNTSGITGSFELLNDGSVTGSQTFDATGHVFDNTTYTRADIFAFAPTAVAITGEAKQGQTLTANAVTNESDATINYEWQHSSDGVHWSDVGTNSSTYVVQDSDQGFKIHVIATTADGDNSHAPATATSAATSVVPTSEPAPVISQVQSFETGTINSNGLYAPQVGNGGNSLELTDSNNSEATSWFAAHKVSVAAFHASFDYQGVNELGQSPADGIAFVLQNSPEGQHALGGAGGDLGYAGDFANDIAPITPSAAIELNLYDGHVQGTNLALDGGAFNYNSTLPLDFWDTGDKIHVDLAYEHGVLTETLSDLVTQQTYTATYNVDLASAVGSETAYLGFSAGTGALDASQTVSNFAFEQSANYKAGHAPVAIDPTLTLSDPGVTTLAHAAVQITGNLHANDVLAFVNDNANVFGNITAVYTASSGTLELTSAGDTATLAQWQNALDAVSYSDRSENPTQGARTISFQVDNGNGANNFSNVENVSVNVIHAHPDADITPSHLSIDTTHVAVQQNEDGTDTILGLQVSDSGPTGAQSLTISATTAGAPVSSISPSSDTGSVDAINNELASGITYNPGSPQPQTDMVNLTVTDNFGASDTVHFVFNQGGQGPNVSLAGTTGNDVIFGTGNSDTLAGNGGHDQFVFAPTSGQTAAQHTITDFNTHLDTIDLRQFANINTAANALTTATQQGNDTLLTLDPQDTLLLKNVVAANLHASDFIVTPHTGF
ncbi:MAG TPA: FecR domain-containing protein [Bradyrhizobium sp.]|nr:FecR domain-containing protein [Bradyrhizobium sp.]